MREAELHRSAHIGWLRAAVLGANDANDGLISTSSLIVGFAAAHATRTPILLAAVAGLVAGALSMEAGEYVSVSSHADTENAELARERRELSADPVDGRKELSAMYESRGVTKELADEVAQQLLAHDAIVAHARDALGVSDHTHARPLEAALASAAAFAVGAVLPVILVWIVPLSQLSTWIGTSTLLLLAVLGASAAQMGGAPLLRATLRVTFWGALAMTASALVGHLFGFVV
jgi:VIT1/CCC1 family predicted Fe2+/Mn2+ transporter